MDGERFVDQIFKKKTKLVDVSDDSFFYRLRQKFDPACFPFACFPEIFHGIFAQVGYGNRAAAEGYLFQLPGSARTQYGKNTFVIFYQFADGFYIFPFFLFRKVLCIQASYDLFDFVGVVYRFVLDRRKAIVEHHILHMQHAVFPRGTLRFFVCRFDVTVLYCQFDYCIKHHDGHIAGHQLEQQTVCFLRCPFPAFQIEYAYTLMFSTGIHHQRNGL